MRASNTRAVIEDGPGTSRARLAIERLQASGFSVEHDSEASILGTVRWLLEEQA